MTAKCRTPRTAGCIRPGHLTCCAVCKVPCRRVATRSADGPPSPPSSNICASQLGLVSSRWRGVRQSALSSALGGWVPYGAKWRSDPRVRTAVQGANAEASRVRARNARSPQASTATERKIPYSLSALCSKQWQCHCFCRARARRA